MFDIGARGPNFFDDIYMYTYVYTCLFLKVEYRQKFISCFLYLKWSPIGIQMMPDFFEIFGAVL